MAWFKNKNPNEVNYQGGKKHFTDVIKNTGSSDILIWRQPEEDFNTNSTLVVMPGESAIFVDCGKIVEVLKEGTHKLTTENYPFLSRLRNAFSGGISSFNCVIYFVRTAVSKELCWGTRGRIQVRDKVWKIRTDIGARGAFKLSVSDPSLLLMRLLGNNAQSMTQNEVFDYFGEELQGKIISVLSNFFNFQWPTELLGLESCLQELSSFLKPQVNKMFQDYGLLCESFSISGLPIDTTKYDAIDEAQVQQNKMMILGENWARLTAAEILHALAENPGAGGVASVGAGLGMGVAAGGAFSNLAGQLFGNFSNHNVNPGNTTIPGLSGEFGNSTFGSRFVQADVPPEPPHTETPEQPNTASLKSRIDQLRRMKDSGAITEEEYYKLLEKIMNDQ